jgi:RNA 2',3'-cyclic 3'-phosphodiesterase
MARDRASRPHAKALRLFVAFDVSAPAMDAVDGALAPWRDTFPRARWVPRRNWHVTLKFLGQTWPRLEPWVRGQVEAAAAANGPFDTALTGLGSFPSASRARVFWAGLDDARGALARLAAALDDALAEEFAPEKRAYAPHLTVARSDPPVRLPEGFARTPVEPVRFRVRTVVLFRSHLQRPAPRYEPLAVVPLGPLRQGDRPEGG